MHKLCIIDNIWSGHFPPNVFGFGINLNLDNFEKPENRVHGLTDSNGTRPVPGVPKLAG